MLGLFTRNRRRPRPVRRAPRHRLFGLQRLETRECPTTIGALTMFGSDGLSDFSSNFSVSPDGGGGSPRDPIVALAITVDGRQIAGGNWMIEGTVSGVEEVGGLTITLTGSDSSFGTQTTTTYSDGSYAIMWTPPTNFQGSSITASVTVGPATATANTNIG